MELDHKKYALLRSFLEENVFFILLGANDTFAYACADITQMCVEDLDKALELYEKYGCDGVIAFQAHIRKADPLRQLQTEKYKEARKLLKDYVLYGERDYE